MTDFTEGDWFADLHSSGKGIQLRNSFGHQIAHVRRIEDARLFLYSRRLFEMMSAARVKMQPGPITKEIGVLIDLIEGRNK